MSEWLTASHRIASVLRRSRKLASLIEGTYCFDLDTLISSHKIRFLVISFLFFLIRNELDFEFCRNGLLLLLLVGWLAV